MLVMYMLHHFHKTTWDISLEKMSVETFFGTFMLTVGHYDKFTLVRNHSATWQRRKCLLQTK